MPEWIQFLPTRQFFSPNRAAFYLQGALNAFKTQGPDPKLAEIKGKAQSSDAGAKNLFSLGLQNELSHCLSFPFDCYVFWLIQLVRNWHQMFLDTCFMSFHGGVVDRITGAKSSTCALATQAEHSGLVFILPGAQCLVLDDNTKTSSPQFKWWIIHCFPCSLTPLVSHPLHLGSVLYF